jgi:hypothetical protein
MWMLYRKTFNKFYNKQGIVPTSWVYQINDCNLEYNDYVYSVLCFKGSSLNQSSNFKTQAKIVKSFYKKINPGDTLDFRMTHHCGPGVRFDIINSYMTAGAEGNQPSSYGIAIEAIGTPCEGVRK